MTPEICPIDGDIPSGSVTTLMRNFTLASIPGGRDCPGHPRFGHPDPTSSLRFLQPTNFVTCFAHFSSATRFSARKSWRW
jgi:hypothetical protein